MKQQKQEIMKTQKNYTEEQFKIAEDIVNAHNQKVNPNNEPWCADGKPGYLIIDLTGDERCFFTLYRFHNQTLASQNPFSFIQNLSTDLIEAVKKVATGKGLPIMFQADNNFNPNHIPHIAFPFGKYKGESISGVYEKDAQYVIWMANNFTAKNKKQKSTEEVLKAIKEAHFQMLTEANRENCKSEFQGELKERSDYKLKILSSKVFKDPFGYNTNPRYRAIDENENLFQFYSKDILENGVTYNVKGTVRSHKEYVGKKYTCINRVKISEI